MNIKEHWEKVYHSKPLTELGWYQKSPVVSWKLMQEMKVNTDSSIIDIGGGDSLFVDFLLEQGYKSITVLDISEAAIERAKSRLGKNAAKVNWLITDITEFVPESKYDLWHDRAVMHFLTEIQDVEKYLNVCRKAVADNGNIIVGAFSDKGPEKCSGLPVRRYSEMEISNLFSEKFKKVKCVTDNHVTPSGNEQNYIYCGFTA